MKFIRQKPLDKYIVDFYCSKLMLAVEVDGDSHAEQAAYDEKRTERLNQLGVTVIRYTNREVMGNIPDVYEDLERKISSLNQPPKYPCRARRQRSNITSPLSGGLV